MSIKMGFYIISHKCFKWYEDKMFLQLEVGGYVFIG